jgi:hypothetical protein
MGSTPGVAAKIAAAGLGLTGLALFKSQNAFFGDEMRTHETHMVEMDRINTMLHHRKKASQYGFMTNWVNWIYDPARTHFIRRPMIYIKGYRDMAMNNLIPIGLMVAGITWGFNKSLTGLAKTTGKAIGAVAGPTGRGLWTFAKAAGSMMSPLAGIGRLFKIPASPSPKGVLAVAAGMGMAAYVLHLFSKEVRGINQEEVMNFYEVGH